MVNRTDDVRIKIQKSYSPENENIVYFSPYPADGCYASVCIKPSGFLSEDFKGSHPGIDFIEIYDIWVEPHLRNMGVGSALIKSIVKEFGDRNVILTAAGASRKEYPVEPLDEKLIEITEGLRPFYEKNNFVDVNDYYAGYEHKRAYMYKNPIGLECLEKRKKDIEEFENSKKNKTL